MYNKFKYKKLKILLIYVLSALFNLTGSTTWS